MGVHESNSNWYISQHLCHEIRQLKIGLLLDQSFLIAAPLQNTKAGRGTETWRGMDIN
jgi:hypothetical protein